MKAKETYIELLIRSLQLLQALPEILILYGIAGSSQVYSYYQEYGGVPLVHLARRNIIFLSNSVQHSILDVFSLDRLNSNCLEQKLHDIRM